MIGQGDWFIGLPVSFVIGQSEAEVFVLQHSNEHRSSDDRSQIDKQQKQKPRIKK